MHIFKFLSFLCGQSVAFWMMFQLVTMTGMVNRANVLFSVGIPSSPQYAINCDVVICLFVLYAALVI